MIREFIESWPLFWTSYVVGWLAAGLLGLVGVIVVARDQVFLGAAVSQVSTLGVALAMWLAAALGPGAPPWMEGEGFLTATAIAASVAAALATTREGGPGRESREAVNGWLFLLGAAGSTIVVAGSPHGLSEVQRLVSSSLIGATRGDLWALAVLAAPGGMVMAVWWRPILLWVMDPAMAGASGVRTGLLRIGLAVGLGIAIGVCIRSAGLVYTFGCLVLPALIAKSLAREVQLMLVLSPLIAVSASATSFVAANSWDLPPGQLTVALLALLVPVGWGLRRVRRSESA